MKKVNLLNITLFVALIAMFASCEDKMVTKRTYIAYTPVYMSYNELRSAVKVSTKDQNIELKQPGKIYFKDNYIFINELHKGIHVYDNTNPKNPIHHAFIEIPGNVDMAIKDDILYADSYVDLVSIDISDYNNLKEISRVENVFPYTLPETDYQYAIAKLDETKGVVLSWEVNEVTDTLRYNLDNYYFLKNNVDFAYADASSQEASTNGVGGSMARFIIYQDLFYVLKAHELEVFDISMSNEFESIKKINTNRVAETVFIANGRLFVGTQTGMEIYDLQNPENPTFISDFNHVQSCDPVVVKGNLAYVTLRSGTFCGNVSNQLDVIDISNITSPTLLKTYPMTSPYGLGISNNNVLFVCDGNAGLKIYDATDPLTISQHHLVTFPNINMFDVIPLPAILLGIGSDGLYQYDYSDLQNITLLSKISIVTTM